MASNPPTPTGTRWNPLDPKAPPITNEAIARAAIEAQVILYPQVIRSRTDPPIPGHTHCILSFHLLPEPLEIRGKGGSAKAVGFVKCRGTYPDEELATRAAARLVLEQDSVFKQVVSLTGSWVPFVADPTSLAGENFNVQTMEQFEKEREKIENKRMAINQALAYQKEEEMKQREKDLRSGDGDHMDPDSIEYSARQAVTFLTLIREAEKQRKKLQNILDKQKQQHEIIEYLRRRHADYFDDDAWLTLLNQERAKENIQEEILLPDERDIFEMRIDRTRAPKLISRKPKAVMINLKGATNDPDNFEMIYPEYEEDYRLEDGDTAEDKHLKGKNLALYYEKRKLAEQGDRKAMAAICPWKLDGYGRIIKDASDYAAPPSRLPPGTEDMHITLPDTSQADGPVPHFITEPSKQVRQQTFPDGMSHEEMLKEKGALLDERSDILNTRPWEKFTFYENVNGDTDAEERNYTLTNTVSLERLLAPSGTVAFAMKRTAKYRLIRLWSTGSGVPEKVKFLITSQSSKDFSWEDLPVNFEAPIAKAHWDVKALAIGGGRLYTRRAF